LYVSLSGPVYTSRTLTGVKLNNNWTHQYSSPEIFGNATKALSRNYTKHKFSDYVYFVRNYDLLILLSVQA